MSQIRFYTKSAAYFEFSNFYEGAPFESDGVYWPTVEHYFQAIKFDNPEYRELIRSANTPNKAFILGSQKKRGGYAAHWTLNKQDARLLNDLIDQHAHVQIRADWDAHRITAMEKALLAKFSQNRTLRSVLLETGDVEIVEDSPRDWFWGCGKDGKGENMLGKLLMKVRSHLSGKN